MDEFDKDFLVFETEWEYNSFVLDEIRKKVNRAIEEHDYAALCPLYEGLDFKRFVMSSEYSRISLCNIIRVYEMDLLGENIFWNDAKNVDDLLYKYEVSLFALRRIDTNITDELVFSGIERISELSLSSVAIANILANELFERRINTALLLYEFICKDKTVGEKIRWLLAVGQIMKEDYFYIVASYECKKVSYIEDAIRILKLIETPTEEVLSLVSTLEKQYEG